MDKLFRRLACPRVSASASPQKAEGRRFELGVRRRAAADDGRRSDRAKIPLPIKVEAFDACDVLRCCGFAVEREADCDAGIVEGIRPIRAAVSAFLNRKRDREGRGGAGSGRTASIERSIVTTERIDLVAVY